MNITLNLRKIPKINNWVSKLYSTTVPVTAVIGRDIQNDLEMLRQEKAMKEKCFLVDTNDKIIGSATKKDCHRVTEDEDIPLHRAFSVFLFNTRGDLLLQKRSEYKLTYPDHYTNTCCSHPLADIAGEENEQDALGIKLAAQRRLNYELGIPLDEVQPKDMLYLTRILYKDLGNGIWGEHEIDYILFIKKDVQIKPNPNEVNAICYVPRGELNAFLPTLESPLTPWFTLIVKHRLGLWWDHLDNVKQFMDHKKIYQFS